MKLINRGTVLTALLALAALPTALAAQRGGAQDRAAVSVYAGGVDFRPSISYSQATLTVSGNGQTYSYHLAPGRRVSIGMFGPDGQFLDDGTYTWSLDFVPTAADATRLRAEAAENDGRALAPWTAQSGSFAIQGGVIADAGLVEAQQRTAAETRDGASISDFGTSSFGTGREAAQDDDGAVGSQAGVEAQVNATAGRQAPAASGGVLLQPDRTARDDSDAISAAMGRSLERAAAANDNQFSAQSQGALAPRPRSDGSNGRPRSDR